MMRLTALLMALAIVAGCADPSDQERPRIDSMASAEVDLPPPELPPEDSLQMAPAFALPSLEGDTLRLEDVRGQVALVNFWATWCAPCRVETPDLVELYETLHDDGFTVVGIAMDRGGADIVQPFVDEYEVPYPVVLGDDAVAAAFDDVYGLPTTFVLDRQGRVVRRILGRVDPVALRSLVQQLLADSA